MDKMEMIKKLEGIVSELQVIIGYPEMEEGCTNPYYVDSANPNSLSEGILDYPSPTD